MSELRNKSKNAFKWSFTGNLSNQITAFIFSIFLARLLTPDEFGLIAIVNVLLTFSEAFSDIGLSVSLLQRKEINKLHLGSVFWFNIFMGLFLVFLFNISANFIAEYYDESELADMIRVMSIIVIINSFSKVINARLHRNLQFRLPVIASVLATIISGGVGVILALYEYGVWSLVFQALSFAFIKNSLIIIYSRFKPELSFSFKALKELWTFGFSMFITGLTDNIYKNVDALIIGKLFPTHTLGQYNRAKYLSTILSTNVIASLNSILLPTMAKTQDDNERIKRIALKFLELFSFISFFIFGLSFILGKDAILIVFGDQWGEAVGYFRIIIVSAVFFPLDVIIKNIISSLGRAKSFLVMELLKKISLSINLVVGFLFGIEGFLYGLIFAGFINLVITIVFACRSIKVTSKFFTIIIIKYSIYATIATVATWYAFDFMNEKLFLHAIFAGIQFTAIYLLLNIVFKTNGFKYFVEEISNSQKFQQFAKRIKSINFIR